MRKTYVIASSWTDAVIPRHFQALAHELAARGHRVIFLADYQESHITALDENPAVLAWPSPRPTTLRDATFLWRLIRQHHPDCLLANFGSVNLMMLVGWLTRVPLRIAWYHTVTATVDYDNDFPPLLLRLLRWRKSRIYGLATHLVANSEGAAKDARTNFGISPEKCVVRSYTLADPLLALDLATPPIDRTANPLCVGRLWPTKGQDVLIRALADLASVQPDLIIDFIGDGPSRGDLEKLAASLAVADRCRFLGAKPHPEVLQAMAAAPLVITPSRGEAFGLVNIEALAVGTPVIGSDAGGIPEIVQEGVNGYLFPSEDHRALAGVLDQFLGLPAAQRRSMRRAAREHFLAHFVRASALPAQADWLEELIAKTGKRSVI